MDREWVSHRVLESLVLPFCSPLSSCFKVKCLFNSKKEEEQKTVTASPGSGDQRTPEDRNRPERKAGALGRHVCSARGQVTFPLARSCYRQQDSEIHRKTLMVTEEILLESGRRFSPPVTSGVLAKSQPTAP